MNEQILDTMANVGVTLAAFSGIVVAFWAVRSNSWPRAEMRVLQFLVVDSFMVVFLALLPFPLVLFGGSEEFIWSSCSALLGAWFLLGFALAVIGERRGRARGEHKVAIPVVTPMLYAVGILGPPAGIGLLLSASGLLPGGQAVFVAGLMLLLAFAAVEFLFLIAVSARQGRADQSSSDS